MSTFRTQVLIEPMGTPRLRHSTIVKVDAAGKKTVRGHGFTPDRYTAWKADVAEELRRAWQGRTEYARLLGSGAIDVPAKLVVVALFRRPQRISPKKFPGRVPHDVKPDNDNVLKAVQDALQLAGVLADDARIFDCRCVAYYVAPDEQPSITIDLEWSTS
jgi:Holliday junction resolvase RusA-like endonuclease